MNITKLINPMSKRVNLKNKEDKIYVSYHDDSKERFFLVMEDGYFYHLAKDQSYSRLTYSELLEVLFGLLDKEFKVEGFGFYGESIKKQRAKLNRKEVL